MKSTNQLIGLFVFCMASVFVLNDVQAQGKLGRVREAVKSEKPSSKAKKNDGHREERTDRDRKRSTRSSRVRRNQPRRRKRGCDVGFGIFVDSFVSPPVNEVHVIHHAPPVIAAPTPVVLQPQIPERVSQPVVAPVAEPSIVHPLGNTIRENWMSSWGVRLSAFGGTDFDDISQGSFALLLLAPKGLGLDTSVTMLRESGMSFRDHLYLGDVNVVYEPVVSDTFRLRLGVGVSWLGDSFGGDAGFNMTSGFDWQLGDRWMATGEVDFGTLGDTDLTHAQISLGKLLNQNTEWATGYDYRDIGRVTFGTVFTGLRFRF